MSNIDYNEQDKLKAAYALNMCTVSVSQIVDYNDEYILEQEYNAILNNINLEQMPKDEALLSILVKLLNVITFFRIDKIKRDQIDKKYQRRMENAIWSAIPSIGVIATGDPVGIGLSLATQVGIGYMNYRREKANATAEKEDAQIELRITAIEQLNALRRELFTTAWRLADEYNFPDKYRLTERQITQYNEILMDPDEIRKYERLMSVKDKFEAYLPFWYFAGHSAKYISEDENNGLDHESRNYFKNQAKQHFEKYNNLNSYNILREDELTASFALEYSDLLLVENTPDNNKIKNLIDTAVEMAGNSNDILEICAMSYLKLNDYNNASTLLRRLVNENYNTVINAQILSSIYVNSYIHENSLEARANYELLSTRVDDDLLYPMPSELSANDLELESIFIKEQKDVLREKYRLAIVELMLKYMIQYGAIIPYAEKEEQSFGNGYFIDDERVIEFRKEYLKKIFDNEEKKENYCFVLKEAGIPFKIIDLLNSLFDACCKLSFLDDSTQNVLADDIEQRIIRYQGILTKLQTALDEDTFTYDYMCTLLKMDFNLFTEVFYDHLIQYMNQYIESRKELQDFSLAEQDLIEFCESEELADPNDLYYKNISEQDNDFSASDSRFSYDLLGDQVVKAAKNYTNAAEMSKTIKKMASKIILDTAKAEMLMRDDSRFDRYFSKNTRLAKNKTLKSRSLAILNDLTRKDQDLLFTVNGLVPIKGGNVKKTVSYGEITMAPGRKDGLLIDGRFEGDGIDINNLYSLFQELKGKEKTTRVSSNTRRWKLPEIKIPIIRLHDNKK